MPNSQLNRIGRIFSTILIDPPWRFTNRTGKVAPEHKRLRRYPPTGLRGIDVRPPPILHPVEGERVLDPIGIWGQITRLITAKAHGFIVTTTEHVAAVFVLLDDRKERVWLVDPEETTWAQGRG